MIRAVHLSSFVLSICAAAPAFGESPCREGEVEAVERIMDVEQIGPLPFSDGEIHSLLRTEAKLYRSNEGEEYTSDEGEAYLIQGLAPNGEHIFAWEPFSRETWHTGGQIYRSSTSQGERRDSRGDKNGIRVDPSVPIEESTAGAGDADIVAGLRCERKLRAFDAQKSIESCHVRVYGKSMAIFTHEKHEDTGYEAIVRTRSLKTLCVRRTAFAPPERDWR